MFEYIKGNIAELTPTYAVIDCVGVGYFINISVNTYTHLNGKESAKLFVHQMIREDAHTLYGFYSKIERQVFRLLISISGIGANTASVMLSSLSVEDIVSAVQSENVNLIKSVKGIGLKTAQRVIIELKDKVTAIGVEVDASVVGGIPSFDNSIKEEAQAALVMLGFVKVQVNKVLDKLIAQGGITTVEELIKHALKQL